jgi:fumarylacetoacetate (FAA) hydrolase family protein
VDYTTCLADEGVYVGRVLAPGRAYPLVVRVAGGAAFDITSPAAPTVRDVCEMADPAGYVRMAAGTSLGSLAAIERNSSGNVPDPSLPRLLSPVDLQAIKAAGVTFAASLLERVVEEQARGDAARAAQIRGDIVQLIGEDLSALRPGSPAAMACKQALLKRGAWSQYLEVGIGPDPEIFTKCQPMSSVGFGADVGLHPRSRWNNPEPEVVVIASSDGTIVGATLGNDVNLRDVEGRSALLLGQAKDNNASAAIGPFIRLFDADFTLEDVSRLRVKLRIVGEDGFALEGLSDMSKISRSPAQLVAAALGRHHQYPDGLALFLGTMYVPATDRVAPGQGFTHQIGDVVSISAEGLGNLVNRVRLSTECPPWTYGVRALMSDLAGAGLLGGAGRRSE